MQASRTRIRRVVVGTLAGVVLIAGALVVGLVVGAATGGSLKRLADVHFRWWWLALVGLGLQLVPVPSMSGELDHWLAFALLLASYALLLLFVAANVRLPGMVVVGVGFALNLLVIAVNGGMPVSASALRTAAGDNYAHALRDLEARGGAKHHVSGAGDTLTPLSDVFGVAWPVGNVYSVGDVVSGIGLAWLVAAATRGRAKPPGDADADR